MTTYSWTKNVSGDWDTAADWTPAAIPSAATADVTIDAATTLPYTVTIAHGESVTVDSLSINAANNLLGSNAHPYAAAVLEVDGTLTFAPGSTGGLRGSLQTYLVMQSGTIVNAGTVDAFIQGRGNVLFTGTNGLYVTNWLQALNGTVTVDTSSIAELTGPLLFDGIFEAQGPNAAVDLGGPLEHLIVNIATVEGPPAIPGGWTELLLNGVGAEINEWNGTGYVTLESTLKDIHTRGTVDILAGKSYTTANTLTVDAGGMLNMQASTLTAAALNINGGVVQGSGTIANGVLNNGTLVALGGTLDITGGLTGGGVVRFDTDEKPAFSGAAVTATVPGATLELAAVSASQVITMNGDDTLILATPAAFAGTIAAQAGDRIQLLGVTATSAVDNAGTLVVSNGSQAVATLALAGNYSGDTFTASGSTIAISPTAAPTGLATLDTTTNQPVATVGQAYTGPVSGVTSEFITTSSDSLNVTATTPGWFIHTGSGNDAIKASSGINVLDGSTGSNFLVGGTGADTFFVDDRNAPADIWSTVSNFHANDAATIFGVTQSGFALNWFDGQGATGYTGLTLHATAAGKPTASLTLVGYTTADLTDGKLSISFGTTAATATAPSSGYMYIHAN